MELQAEQTQIEAQLRERGLSVGDLCKRADIARSTWDRWKRGETEPNIKTWRAVTGAFDALIIEADAAPQTPTEDAA